MAKNRLSLHSPVLRFLSDEQREEIHLSTLEVLERTGLQINHHLALKLVNYLQQT